ncbi:MAG: AMP-binding protein, partial [Chlorobiales bacterium]|nr:AMP-binding protein [Chlorobiales bacterium]
SPARMTAYLNKADETASVLADDWFKTGDLATISEDGCVRIVGRKKDMIVRGGYTIAAGEVEAVLMTHPAIAEAAVIGVADPDLGEEIAAFIALRPEARLSADEVVAFCRDHLARYKYPRHVRFAAELPKGPAGKVIKAQLRL